MNLTAKFSTLENTETVDSAEDLEDLIDSFTGNGTICNAGDLKYFIGNREVELSEVTEKLKLSDHEKFDLILKKCYTTNASGKPIFSYKELDDSDLVKLGDLASDYAFVFESDNWGQTIAAITVEKAGLEEQLWDSEDSGEVYDNAVEILRQRLN